MTTLLILLACASLMALGLTLAIIHTRQYDQITISKEPYVSWEELEGWLVEEGFIQ